MRYFTLSTFTGWVGPEDPTSRSARDSWLKKCKVATLQTHSRHLHLSTCCCFSLSWTDARRLIVDDSSLPNLQQTKVNIFSYLSTGVSITSARGLCAGLAALLQEERRGSSVHRTAPRQEFWICSMICYLVCHKWER